MQLRPSIVYYWPAILYYVLLLMCIRTRIDYVQYL